MELSIIFLSFTKNEDIQKMTHQAMETALAGESNADGIEIILVESNKDFNRSGFQYPLADQIIIPDSTFGFHRFLNIGIKQAKGEWIALCNNDLIFFPGWFSAIREVHRHNPGLLSFSPVDPDNEESSPWSAGQLNYEEGYDIRKHVKGWCIIAHQSVFKSMGYLDEAFEFYYSDDDYGMSLRQHGIRNALVRNSQIRHLEAQSSDKPRIKPVNPEDHPDLPSWISPESDYKFLYRDPRMLDGHLKFHRKWGSPKKLAMLRRASRLFEKMGLRSLSKSLFRPKV